VKYLFREGRLNLNKNSQLIFKPDMIQTPLLFLTTIISMEAEKLPTHFEVDLPYPLPVDTIWSADESSLKT
jgi:hypothetical protein